MSDAATIDRAKRERGGSLLVTSVDGGGVRVSVTHGGCGVCSYTNEFCTGIELPADLWRQVIEQVQERLPPIDSAAESAALGGATAPEQETPSL